MPTTEIAPPIIIPSRTISAFFGFDRDGQRDGVVNDPDVANGAGFGNVQLLLTIQELQIDGAARVDITAQAQHFLLSGGAWR